jgi:hypothetical protein
LATAVYAEHARLSVTMPPERSAPLQRLADKVTVAGIATALHAIYVAVRYVIDRHVNPMNLFVLGTMAVVTVAGFVYVRATRPTPESSHRQP